MTPKEQILQVAGELGLTMTAEFVPFSQSRNKAEKMPSLNWLVTISRNVFNGGLIGKEYEVLTTDYMAGCAHAPGYKRGDRSVIGAEVVRWECENGVPGRWSDNANVYRDIRRVGKPIEPDFAAVINSLALDYSVIDYSNYEDWAPDVGYDPDSRKGEAIYRACLEIALKLRSAIGEDGMTRLRDACAEY